MFIFVLKNIGKDFEVKSYMDECKALEQDPEQFTTYIHGYWVPWLQEQRMTGKISKGNQSH